MRVHLTNPLTGESRTYRVVLTTHHSESHYGLPVILLEDGEILDIFNAIVQEAVIVDPPRSQKQAEMLLRWQANARAIVGGC